MSADKNLILGPCTWYEA